MICILLVASVETEVEKAIEAAKFDDERMMKLRGLPKALLPVAGRPILDHWWDLISRCREITGTYLVAAAATYKYFERWATAHGLPIGNVINNGNTTRGSMRGIFQDLALGLHRAAARMQVPIEKLGPVLVIGAENLFHVDFDLTPTLRFYEHKKASVLLSYELSSGESRSNYSILELDPVTRRVTAFRERPEPGATSSRLASPIFYVFSPQDAALVNTFVEERREAPLRGEGAYDTDDLGRGRFLEWLHPRSSLYGMTLPSGFSLIGVHSALREYQQLDAYFSRSLLADTPSPTNRSVQCHAYARAGLMGNPSDGFGGKTLAVTVKNFWATVSLTPAREMRLVPHPLFDPLKFGSMADMAHTARREGYQGGLRLLMATCKRFYEHCTYHGISLPHRNFEIRYDTNVPRQVGLAGSSAIVTALLKCLMRFYHLTPQDFPKPMQPQFVLDVEMHELHINAGLQDRVVQCYQGAVFMDFNPEILAKQGHGNYEQLDIALLPKLWLAYDSNPSDSGRMHSNVRARYDAGDEKVRQGMLKFAQFTDDGRRALLAGDFDAFSDLIRKNFALRRALYGDAALGKSNLRMVEIAASLGYSAKFPGSGGAIVGMYQDPAKLLALRSAFEREGFVFCELLPQEEEPNEDKALGSPRVGPSDSDSTLGRGTAISTEDAAGSRDEDVNIVDR